MSRRLTSALQQKLGRPSRLRSRRHDPTPLLLGPRLDPQDVARLLGPYGFGDIKHVDADLQAMASEPHSRVLLAGILGGLLASVAETAEPDQALTHWERFLQNGVNRAQLFEYLAGVPRLLHLLCSIFGNSPAMAQTLIRDPFLVYWLAEEQVLTRKPSRQALAHSLQATLDQVKTAEVKLDALRRFRRREMVRIGVRDLLRLADVQETTAALTDLACVLLQAAYEIADAGLRRRFGTPMHRDEQGRVIETGFTVIAMGKLGGGELNYSSDVDLIYVYASDDGATRPNARRPANGTNLVQKSIPNGDYFESLARDVTRALADFTQEGHVFRVDLRLRAEGSQGPLARSLDAYAHYYRTRGRNWERVALLKACPIAGNSSVGGAFLNRVADFVYGDPGRRVDSHSASAVIQEIRSVKEMIDEKIAGRKEKHRNVKLGMGGIREIEFIVQTAQVLYGGRLPGIRDRNTMGALPRVARYGVLSTRQREILAEAYLFLRDVEHKLQMVHDLQTHALPESPDELASCAIRLGYSPRNRHAAMKRFLADHRRHTTRVHRIFRNLFYSSARSSLLQARQGQKKAKPRAN